MKHHFVTKHVLLSVLLILTLTAMLFSVSAADAASDKNAARLTVVSVKTGETTETLYATAEEAFSAADLAYRY